MEHPPLTTDDVQTLYEARQCVRDHTGLLVTTHHAIYAWSPRHHCYVVEQDGLRVQHRAGAAWSHRRHCFVPCACRWCAAHPEQVADTDLSPPS